MFSFNYLFAVIAILILCITYFFILKKGHMKDSGNPIYTSKSNPFGEDRLNVPTENIFHDPYNFSSSPTISVGGLYRRKPKIHKKKKPSLNKNKYKKHGKPRK